MLEKPGTERANLTNKFMTNKLKQKQRRAVIAETITRSHKHMAVKMPSAYHSQLKSEAKDKGMLLSGYVLGLIKLGKGEA
jgi:hypothetical protein